MNHTEIVEASWLKSICHRRDLTGELPVVVGLSFCRRDVLDQSNPD